MTAKDFTMALFYRVDQALPALPKHRLSYLYPSEIITLGLLYALRGGSFLNFDRWLRRELASLFPRLPERSRLGRLLEQWSPHLRQFLAAPTLLGIIDSYGVSLLHTRRLRPSRRQWAKRGYSNSRWIAGAKVAVVLNSQGEIVDWQLDSANVSVLPFLPLVHKQPMLLLADKGFQLSRKPKKAAMIRRQGRTHPSNLLICQRRAWPERKLIETVFALLTQVFKAKALTQRTHPQVQARLAYVLAAYNLCIQWKGHIDLRIAHFAL